MRLIRLYRPMLLAISLVWCLSGTVSGQSYWHDDAGRAQYRLELLKPFIKNADESFFTGAGFLSGSWLIRTGMRLEAELPFSRTSIDTGEDILGKVGGSRIGNPYVGLVLHRGERPLAFRVGIRLPVIGEPDLDDVAALTAGFLSDVDRIEAFFPERVTLKSAMEWRRIRSDGLLLGALIGSSILADDGLGHADWLADYGLRLGYQSDAFQTYAAVTGRLNLTSDDVDGLSERTQHQLTGSIALRRDRVRPEFLIRLPLDDDVRQAVGVVVGVGLRLVY